MSIYLDNSATTKPLPEVARLVYETLSGEETFGNPGSLHRLGVLAEKDLNESLDKISKLLSCKKDELYFTSCGSESVNTSILGYMHQNPRAGKKVISTKTEHKASLESLEKLAKEGYEICSQKKAMRSAIFLSTRTVSRILTLFLTRSTRIPRFLLLRM